MRTLLYCATWETPEGLAVHPRTRWAIDRLGVPDVVYGTVNPFPGYDHRNVTAQYTEAWRLAIEGDFDYLLTVEHDIEPPADALDKLIACDAPVAYGLYVFRQRTVPVVNCYRVEGRVNPGMSYGLFPDDLRRAKAAGVVEVSGVGFGCTLIRRNVLERVKPQGEKDCDGFFACECLRKGIKQVGRFDVECGHWHEGRRFMPFDLPDMIAVECMIGFVGKGFGPGVKRYEAGQTYKIPKSIPQVDDYFRAGYIRMLQ